jgi:hypothetical protein
VTVYVVAGETLLGQYVIAPTVPPGQVHPAASATLSVVAEVTEVVVTGYTKIETETAPGVYGHSVPSMYLFRYCRDGSWSTLVGPYLVGGGSVIWDDHPHRWRSDNPDARGFEMWAGPVAVFAAAARIRVPSMSLPIEKRYRVALEQMADMGMIVDG